MRQCFLFLISLAFLFSDHPEHPSEHPTTRKKPKLTIEDILEINEDENNTSQSENDKSLEESILEKIKNNSSNQLPASFDYFAGADYPIQAYELFHVSLKLNTIQIQEKDLNIFIDIQNILDKEYQYPGYNDIDYNGIGRTFKITAKTSF